MIFIRHLYIENREWKTGVRRSKARWVENGDKGGKTGGHIITQMDIHVQGGQNMPVNDAGIGWTHRSTPTM
ncbi:MAG: hypothetical protein C0391_00270 [Anaerolinea sp.]|nr:hypothetical protein [Anaerolinea sp.]